MTSADETDLDRLLAHAGWARALARSLVRDAHSADDLVQRAWVAALEHPPESSTPIRRWLAAVMRNFARQDARADERRTRRETSEARAESSEAAHDALNSEAELQARLLAAVRGLEEPLRGTIWARYYEGLPPRAIAARDGLPVKTVKTRLHRGINELRARLDREHGDRRAWLAALMPLAQPPSLSATTLGALLVSTELKVACGLLAVVGAIAVWRLSVDSGSIEPSFATEAPFRGSALESEARHEPKIETQDVSDARTALTPQKPTQAIPAPVATVPMAVHGRVLDLEHRPVAGVAIVERSSSAGEHRTVSERALDVASGHDGRFELPSPSSSMDLGVRSDAWVDVYAARLWHEKTHPDVTIFVAPRRPLAGVVVDGERHGIANADVEIILDAALRRDLGAVLDANVALGWRTKTDEQGHFELSDAPQTASQLKVQAVGWIARGIEAPAQPTYDLEILLARVESAHALVHGRVVDAEHHPVEEAYVSLGSETHRSRADGRFEFDIDAMKNLDDHVSTGDGAFRREFDARTVVTVKAGYLPARAAIPSVEELRREPAPYEVELVVGAKPLEIRGRVVDADGHAVPNAVVRALGETLFGTIFEKTDTGEIGWKSSIEALLRGGSRVSDVATSADGSFTLTGLLDKEYGVAALDRKTLRLAATANVRAGASDVVITLPSENDCVRVAGRVVSPGGDPIAGVRVHLGRGWAADQAYYGNKFFGSFAETDEHGHFEFAKVARADLDFQVSSQSIFILLSWKPKTEDSLDDLTITVSRRCHVQIDLGEKRDFADHAAVLDANGQQLKLLAVHGDISWSPEQFSIENGRSEPLACEETARTIVLYSGGREIERVPFTPKPGELVVVRP